MIKIQQKKKERKHGEAKRKGRNLGKKKDVGRIERVVAEVL